MGTVRMTRRRSRWRDRLRAYKVLVDDELVGAVSNGETGEFSVRSGAHTLALKIDWCRSPSIDFRLAEGELASFVCTTDGGLFRAFTKPSRYIRLDRRV